MTDAAQTSPADEGNSQASAVAGSPFRNVLFAGDFWHGASERAIAQGLRNLGHNVQEVALLDHFLRSPNLALRVAGRLLTPFGRRAYNAEILRAAAAIGPGLFLTLKGSFLAPETLAALRAIGMRTALVYPDRHFDYPDVDRSVIRDVDLLITTKSFHRDYLDDLRGPGRSFMVHHGYSPMAHWPHWDRMSEDDYHYDIAYVGMPDPYKAKWLAGLAGALPHRRMLIVGERWGEYAPGTPLADCRLMGRVTGDLMAELIQRSRVNIAIQLGPGPNGWRDHVSTRTFEIPACKGFMLHEDNEEIRTLFEPGTEIDVFDTPGSLHAQVEHYLARPDRRSEMIERAYRRAVPAYSYYERARELMAVVRRELGG